MNTTPRHFRLNISAHIDASGSVARSQNRERTPIGMSGNFYFKIYFELVQLNLVIFSIEINPQNFNVTGQTFWCPRPVPYILNIQVSYIGDSLRASNISILPLNTIQPGGAINFTQLPCCVRGVITFKKDPKWFRNSTFTISCTLNLFLG